MSIVIPDEDVPAEFLAAAAGFIQAAAAQRRRDAGGRDAGAAGASAPARERVALFPDLTPQEEQAELAAARAWRQERFDAGFGWLSGPAEYGGAGLSAAHERAYLRLERGHAFPPQRIYDIGLGMVAPAILAFGTEAAKQRYLRATAAWMKLVAAARNSAGTSSSEVTICSRLSFLSDSKCYTIL